MLDENGTKTASFTISNSGVLDITNLDVGLGALTVGANGGSFVLGESGRLEFQSLTSWDNANPVFFIQGSGGGWDSSTSPNYVSFVTEPSLSSTQLSNVVFSGYETGGAVEQDSVSLRWFLKPAEDALLTAEWTGQSQPNFAGVKWSEPGNWLSGSGTVANVPGSLGGLKSATFRDIDERLDSKIVLVDNTAYTLAHLNIETNTRKFFLNSSNGGNLIFADDGDVTARIKHSGLSTLEISAPIQLNSNLNLVLNAKHAEGYVILAGQITGTGGIIKTRSIADSATLGGDLRITGSNNTFEGGFTWDDNIGHLQILYPTDSTANLNATPLGEGLVTFGSSATSVTRVEGTRSVYHVNTPGGFLLYGGIDLQEGTVLGVASNAARYLYIDASKSSTGILLAPGNHAITTNVTNASYRKYLYLVGGVSDLDPTQPASLSINSNYITLYLIGDNSFGGITSTSAATTNIIYLNGNNILSGGISMSGSSGSLYLNGNNIIENGVSLGGSYSYLYLGNDNALGTAPLTISGSTSVIYATNAGYSTLTGTDPNAAERRRRITNQLIFTGSASTSYLLGNLMFDRNQGEDWTLDLNSIDATQLILRPDSQYSIGTSSSFGKIGPAFGENFVISGGANKKLRFDYNNAGYYIMRFFNSGSTYSGGTDINGSTTYNFYVVLGADSVMNGGTLESGPFGTGLITSDSNLVFVPWSTDPTKTTRTLSNEIKIGSTNLNFNTISVLKTNEVEVENCANTIILNSTQQLILPRAMNFSAGEGAVLQIDSQITGSYPLTKIGVGAVVLTNNNNNFSQANVNAGALIGRAAAGDVIIAPPSTSGRAGYFGAGNVVVIDNTAFDVQADNYATGRAALVVETPGAVTVSSGPNGAQPFYLVGQGAAFIVGGGEGGTGMGFNGAGILRFDGNSTIHGRVAPDATDALGWLVADRMLKDTPNTTTIGLNLRTNHLEISNSGTISMQTAGLLSGVADLHFTSGGGTLDLAETSQSLRASLTSVGGGVPDTRYSTIGADAGTVGYIKFTANEALPSEGAPILFTFGQIGDDHAGAIHFVNWQGDTDDGLGPTRVVTTGHRRGELVRGVYLDQPGQPDSRGITIVMLNSDGQNVLLPLGDELVWSGNLAALVSSQPNSEDYFVWWEGVYTPSGGGPSVSNWRDTVSPGIARYPGSLGILTDIGNLITFDTTVEPGSADWDWSNLVIPITSDGFSAVRDDATKVALAGSILVEGTDKAAHITFASGLNFSDVNGSRLTLDNGEEGNVSVLIDVNARLSINLPIFLVSISEGAARYNNLIINTADSDSIVELNETITGSLGSVLYKKGAGHLYIRGDNDPDPPGDDSTPIPGLSGGIVLEGGHLYVGNPKSIGSYNDGARITFKGGTIHPVRDWYVPGYENGSGIYEPGAYVGGSTPPSPDAPDYADLELPNNYRFAGDFSVAGNKTLSFHNDKGPSSTSATTGEVVANSTVTILDKDGKLVLDGTTIGSSSSATYEVTFKGPGDVLIRKSGETGVGIHLIANASAADVAEATSGGGAPPLVERASPSVKGNVSNIGHGALKLSNYAGAGGTTDNTVTNSNVGTLEIATTGNSYGGLVQNTGTGTTTVNGAGNTFAGGITTSGGGTFVINAANNANGNISVLGSSKLELNAGVGHATTSVTTPITANIYSGGKLLVNATASAAGSLTTGSSSDAAGSVTLHSGGIIEFIVAENGSHGFISTGTLTAQSGSALKVSFDASFNASNFVSGYAVDLFNSPSLTTPNAPTFIDNSGWAQGQNVTITLGGNAIDLGTDLVWRFDKLAEEGEIYIGDRILPGLYWDGTMGQVWNLDTANEIWRHSEFYETNREYAVTNGGELAFEAGERAIFDKRLRVDTPPEAPLTLDVQVSNSGNAIEVHSLLVLGNGSDFVFDGDEIRVVGPFTPVGGTGQYEGVPVRITVGNQANPTFNNKVTSPILLVENSGKATLVYKETETSGNGGNDKFSFANGIELSGTNATLVLRKEGTEIVNDAVTPTFIISGIGNVEKTGGGMVIFNTEHTYNGVPVGDGTFVGGATRVKEGHLTVQSGLGNSGEGLEFAYSVGSSGPLTSTRNYNGAIEIETGAMLTFVNTASDYANGQRLGGHIGHGYGEIGADGYTHAASIDGKLDFNGGYIEIAGERNSFQGSLNVRSDGGVPSNAYLKISGGIGTIAETFDGTATYYHNRFAGEIRIHQNATVEFANNNDYQYLSGNISGAGTLKIAGSMPVYFAGNASTFVGKTTVEPNGILHLHVPAGTQYGTTGSTFYTKSAATLYVGGGGRIYTNTFQMETNSTLVVNPGKFTIQETGLGEGIKIGTNTSANVTLVFRLAQEDVNEDVAKLALKNSGGGSAGVELSGGKTLRADAFGYIPQPSQNDKFTLMSGLDTIGMNINTMTGSTDREKGEALALLIFNQNELEIMNSRFSLFFTVEGNLMLEQTSYTGIPEPATYGLFSGVFIAAFALIGRRRKRRLAAAA
ncbi:MAG: hypothetical protein LBS59_01170 [Puniceicoccales bacterium]|nr:hypothetical protein [Puniceicoccales bacterium]